MQLEVRIDLPRQRRSVTAVRRMVATALVELGVREEDRDDLVTALSEACTNAVQHARGARRYQVALFVDGQDARIEVHDQGHEADDDGFAVNGHHAMAAPHHERGRGIALMGRLVDTARFDHDGHGTTVILRRRIRAAQDSLLEEELPGS